MLQVTKEDISVLRDDDLRELIGLLCESVLSRYSKSSACVMYGGNQDAPDGGVDVIVNTNENFPEGEYLPRGKVLFQVKVPKMSLTKIEKEMKPSNLLRDSIKEVLSQNGAYIIVSSKSDVTNAEYKKRINKMKECTSELSDISDFFLDFYDCKRISSWVNTYPAMKVWVKNKCGVSYTGWQSFSEWKKTNYEFEREFVFDNTSGIYINDYSDDNRIPLIEAINEIRSALSLEAKSIRLAGLSGVGKTRLAFSLFDKTIGHSALDDYHLLYCDIGYNPNPTPIALIQDLISQNKRAIIIIDNCLKEQHSKLAELVNQNGSKLSLLTIEYDAKQDDIIETENYYMVSSTDSIIKRYLEVNYPDIGFANIDIIVETSGGNFRMAKYFARSINNNSSIGVLNSRDLFCRLFMMENIINIELLKTAEICSILFSFNVNDELELLSQISDLSYEQLYRNVALLCDMQLIQSRGDMRAVLPHGLANRLCSDFLKAIPINNITNVLKNKNRLLLSSSRRLKYLSNSIKAKEFATQILSSLEQFSDFSSLSQENALILTNLSFIVPNYVLNRIESIDDPLFFSNENINWREFVNILLYLSYDQETFHRVITYLIQFALSEKEGEKNSSIRSSVYNLFHLYLSGTHSTVHQRLNSLEILFDLDTKNSVRFAFQLINEMLETQRFFGNSIELRSIKRDYGYYPKTNQEKFEWYVNVLGYLKEKYRLNLYNYEVKDTLVGNFRSLTRVGLIDYLESFIYEVLLEDSWPELWVSIKNTKYFDKEVIPHEILERINKIEDRVKPNSLEDEFIIYVKNNEIIYENIDDNIDVHNSVENHAYRIGVRFGEKLDNLTSKIDLIKEIKSANAIDFGRGLASSLIDIFDILKIFYSEFTKDEFISNLYLFKGLFLAISSDYIRISNALEKILENEKSKSLYPFLQGTYQLKKSDLPRVIRALNDSTIPLHTFESISRCLIELDNVEIVQYLQSIPQSFEGIELIIDTVFWLSRESNIDDSIVDIAARNILLYDFNEKFYYNRISYEFEKVSKIVFNRHCFSVEASNFFINFRRKLSVQYISFSSIEKVFMHIIETHPFEFLNAFLGDKLYTDCFNIRHFLKGSFSKSPLEYVSDDILIEWSMTNSKFEDTVIFTNPYYVDVDSKQCVWTKFAQAVIELVEESSSIGLLEKLISTIYPTSWDSSLSEILTPRRFLILNLMKSKNAEVRAFSRDALNKLDQRISYERESFDSHNRNRLNSFE